MSNRTEAIHIPDHTLLRVIGRGSYGEVWLARNVMGTQRAVKIVRRATFDSDRPWLREFEGIRRCEPVSRAHDGLIDILHMGRNDAEGWFYYVMELADGAHQTDQTDPPRYTPATLSARLAAGQALDISDCLRLAESLAGALAFLHEQGLIHRDVKPSNVMYVGGVPKLGDIGLVAEAGSSRSYVGTEGFVPLEGPGTERADIFALGKVLYEALTGLDREKFPRLPAEWSNAHDFDQRVELNEIVLRACEGDPVRRYHTAREMLADIALVASGRSVKKMRGMERRLKVLRWAGLGAAAVAVVAVSVTWLVKGQADRERTLRERAVQAESTARASQLAALYDQVHAARHDPSAGAVTGALEVARKAAALRVTPELRDDAIFLLSRPDYVPRPDLAFTFTQPCLAMDADSLQMAEMPRGNEDAPGPLTITLHTAGAPEKKRLLQVPDAPAGLSMLQFSRGGQRLLITGDFGPGIVLDMATGEQTGPAFPASIPFGTPLVFCGDKGDAVLRRASGGGLAIYSLPGGERRTTPALADWPVRDQSNQSQRVWPSPDGRFALLIDNDMVLPGQSPPVIRGAACLVEISTGSLVWKVSGPDEQVAAWSHDGTRIAVRHSDFIVSLDAATGLPASHVPRRIQNRGTQLAFLDSRDLLVFSTWSMSGLCDLAAEEMMGRPPVLDFWSCSHGRRLLFAGTGAVECRPSPVLRVFHPSLYQQFPVFFAFPPDEKWLLAGHGRRFSWWNLETDGSAPTAITPTRDAASILFSPDGKSVQFHDHDGRHEVAWTGAPVESLPDPLPSGPGANGPSAYTSASRDGKVLAFGGNGSVLVRREGEAPRPIPTFDIANPVGLSPDGRWLAVGAFKDQDVRVFDLHRSDDEPVHVVACGVGCFPAFSPDGKWFACSGFTANQVFRVNDGEPAGWPLVFSRERSSSYLIGQVSFTADGRLMAVQDTMSRVAIIEPCTWRILFHLDSPLDEIFERNALSPSGRYFAAVGTRREIYVWDLRALERELTARGLGVGAQ